MEGKPWYRQNELTPFGKALGLLSLALVVGLIIVSFNEQTPQSVATTTPTFQTHTATATTDAATTPAVQIGPQQ